MVVMVSSTCISSGDGVTAKLQPLVSAKWVSKGCKLIVFKSQSTKGPAPGWSVRTASDFSCRDPFDLEIARVELSSDSSVLHPSSTL
jgi:hypothetical protein